MRILSVLHTFLPETRGGTEVHAFALARELQRRHDVRIFCRESRSGAAEYALRRYFHDGLPVVRVNAPFVSHTLEWTIRNRAIHEIFMREVERFRPDVVHIHHLDGLSTTIVDALKLEGIPVVYTLHDFWGACPRGQRLAFDLQICEEIDRNRCYHCLNRMWPHLFQDRATEPTLLDDAGRFSPQSLMTFDRRFRFVTNLADVLIAPSRFHRERMIELGVAAERIVALPHGLDHDLIPAAPPRTEPVRTIGFIGSVIPPKGVHVLIDAFRRLGRRDLSLEIWGEAPVWHEDWSYVRRLHSAAFNAGRVRFRGGYEQGDLPGIFRNIDILVIPSIWWETFCLTLREAMLAGVPVVASDTGAIREGLDGGRFGVPFRMGDAADLARKLAILVEDDALRRRLSDVRSAVKTIGQNALEIEAIYDAAIRGSAARRDFVQVCPPTFAPGQTPAPPEEPDPGFEEEAARRGAYAARAEAPAAQAADTPPGPEPSPAAPEPRHDTPEPAQAGLHESESPRSPGAPE